MAAFLSGQGSHGLVGRSCETYQSFITRRFFDFFDFASIA
jgi:hypothetical protein